LLDGWPVSIAIKIVRMATLLNHSDRKDGDRSGIMLSPEWTALVEVAL